MTTKKALIVDDEPDIRELLEITLGRMNVETSSAKDVRSARHLLDTETFDLCLTDMNLPDGTGLQIVQYINANCPDLPVAVITAFGNMDTAIMALKSGAFDFVQKPVDLEVLRGLVDTALKLSQSSTSRKDSKVRLTGTSATMETLRGQIAKLARSQAPIYISGESGSGKEVAARLIHDQGPRSEAAFVPVNCGAIPNELMESEFFGHVKGSFTGAVSDKEGLFNAAEGGSLFLDEVADLPLSMQVKLLRAIQEKAIRAVGAQVEQAIDVRILSATHKDLNHEVAEGRFRQDLFYRLNVIELPIPSLRDRPTDIPELTEQILSRISSDYQAATPAIDDSAVAALLEYDFPGNVRELENILERAFTLCEKDRIQAHDLQLTAALSPRSKATSPKPASTQAKESGKLATAAGAEPDWNLPPGISLEDYLENIERRLINDALEAAKWNKTAAAKDLGITFRALRYRLKKLNLE